MPEPHVREAGHGPAVVCLHSNASTSGQWRALMDQLSPSHHVLAPDLYGAGKSPDWPSAHEIRLDDEVDFIEPVLARAGASFVLAGHSYGAAVALMTALRHPGRVRALALYEPTLFAVVDAAHPRPNGVEGMRSTAAAADAELDAGNPEGAAQRFIDFWMGPGSWETGPPPRRQAIAVAMLNLRRWTRALFTEPTPAQAFAALDMPVLYLLGERSPVSAHAVARVLAPVLPNVEVVTLPGVGHMAPVTHPDLVNEAIAAFLRRV